MIAEVSRRIVVRPERFELPTFWFVARSSAYAPIPSEYLSVHSMTDTANRRMHQCRSSTFNVLLFPSKIRQRLSQHRRDGKWPPEGIPKTTHAPRFDRPRLWSITERTRRQRENQTTSDSDLVNVSLHIAARSFR